MEVYRQEWQPEKECGKGGCGEPPIHIPSMSVDQFAVSYINRDLGITSRPPPSVAAPTPAERQGAPAPLILRPTPAPTAAPAPAPALAPPAFDPMVVEAPCELTVPN